MVVAPFPVFLRQTYPTAYVTIVSELHREGYSHGLRNKLVEERADKRRDRGVAQQEILLRWATRFLRRKEQHGKENRNDVFL
jgi:hypothetical protein